MILADEVLTPDSSRFWPAESWEPGRAQVSYDKQPLRDWLAATSWDKTAPGPELPDEIAPLPGTVTSARTNGSRV